MGEWVGGRRAPRQEAHVLAFQSTRSRITGLYPHFRKTVPVSHVLLFTSGIALVRLISGEAGAGGDLRFLDALKKQQKDLKIEKSI